MKRPTYILLILGLVLGLSGCGKSNKSEGIRKGRCARGGCDSGDTSTGGGNSGGGAEQAGGVDGTSWGQIHKGSHTQHQFYDGLEGFVSASINSFDDPSELGFVNGDIDQDTGVWFYGIVEGQNGEFDPTVSQNIQFNLNDAELRVVVWDEYAGKADKDGNVIPEYPVHIRGASRGFVNGNQITIRFEDSYGWIELKGTHAVNTADNISYFTGYVEFSNNVFWDNKTHNGYKGAKGILGDFIVPTCGFFKCK